MRRWSISVRFNLVVAIAVITVAALVGVFTLAFQRLRSEAGGISSDALHAETVHTLQVATQSLASSLAVQIVDLEPDARIELLQSVLESIRYEEDKSGYFFAYRKTTCVAHPTAKQLIGVDAKDQKDPQGRPYIQQLLAAVEAGGGAVPYTFDKPGVGLRQKLSYATFIPGTDIWIGTGAYLDNIEQKRASLDAALSVVQTRSLLTVVGVAGVLLFLLMLPLSVAIVRSVVLPLRATRDAMRDIASGDADLTRRLEEDGADEVAELSGAYNQFVEQLGGILRQLDDSSQRLSSSSTALKDSSTRMASSAESLRGESAQTGEAIGGVTARMQGMASHSESMSGSVATVAATSEQLSSSSDEIRRSSQAASAQIQAIAAALEELGSSFAEVAATSSRSAEASDGANELAQQASTRMDELGRTAREVTRIVELINDVADQTNLLALNATIEAASAGEAGRGFAVVASEVKELAKQTAAATVQIREQVDSMMSSTDAAIELIRNVSGRSSELRMFATTIAAAVEEQTSTIQELTRNVSSGADAVGEVSASIDQVSDGVGHLAGSASSAADGARSVTSTVGEVSSITNEAKRRVEQLIREAEATTREVEGVASIATDVKTNADSIQGLVGRFRI